MQKYNNKKSQQYDPSEKQQLHNKELNGNELDEIPDKEYKGKDVKNVQQNQRIYNKLLNDFKENF